MRFTKVTQVQTDKKLTTFDPVQGNSLPYSFITQAKHEDFTVE